MSGIRVAFFDIGNAWNRVGEFAQEGFKSGQIQEIFSLIL